MRRRECISLLGGFVVAWPLVAHGQQAMPVIGYLGSASPDAWASRLKAFREGLSEAGFDEGRNVAIEYSWANGNLDRVPELAQDLVRRHVAVLVTPGSAPAAIAAKRATTTIPVVFETGADPVEAGLVASFNHPGGNVTGIAALTYETAPKRLAILHEAIPSARLIAALVNPAAGEAVARQIKDMAAIAPQLGLQLLVLHTTDDRMLDAAFAEMREKRADALVVVADPFVLSRLGPIADHALSQRVPAISVNRQFAQSGGLMSYGGDIVESHHLLGLYVGRVLKGEKPGDLPVIQATKIELVVNLKTAKALGLTLPLSLLGRADEVID